MSDTPSSAAHDHAADPQAPEHAAGHGDDSHGQGEDALGPFDVVMWTFGLVGVMLGILVWAALAIATTAL
jgi:hypothetical protein